jgi:hypothetical protein
MKNKNTLRSVTILLLLLMTGLVLQAQTQPSQESQAKAEYEKQMREKDIQMKELEGQLKKQQMEWEMQMKKQQMEQERKAAELERAYEAQARSSGRARERSFVYTSPGSDEGSYFIQSFGNESQSQLTLRNTFNGETISSDGEFDVDENTSHIRFTANGKVRQGEISIRVLYPGGKVFKALTINPSAQINFSQSMTIKEEERKKYAGTWKYEVKTKTAEGSYMLSIMTH